jgi:hypothetical protein
MKKRKLLETVSCVLGMFLYATNDVQSQEVVVDSRGGVDVWWVPQDAPGPGYSAGKIVLKTAVENAKIVTFENLKIVGDLVQTWLSGPFGGPTAKGPSTDGAQYDPSWIPYDSHLLIRDDNPNMIGGGAGGGYPGISETNDKSIGQIPGLPDVSGYSSVSGLGPIAMADPTDAFFLEPEFHSSEIDLAYIVMPTQTTTCIGLTLGVLGDGIVNAGEPGGANWGSIDSPGEILCIPEPSSLLLGALAGVGLLVRRRW